MIHPVDLADIPGILAVLQQNLLSHKIKENAQAKEGFPINGSLINGSNLRTVIPEFTGA